MSQMELRSSRSRSRTPFLSQEFIEKEATVTGNHVEKVVTRVTRKSTVVKTNEIASSSTDELNTMRSESPIEPKPITRKSTSRSLRSRVIRTSDYSSEDGENEVTSSKTIRQNERNQLVEDASNVVNADSESPALELYKKSGRYWDVYPKTDWTYSHHSKDRFELAPGVVAMPNMSRKAIRPLDESPSQSLGMYSDNVSHKNINTENTYVTRYSEGTATRSGAYNNNSEDFYIKRRTHTRWSSFKQTITTIVSTICTTIYTVFYYSFRIQRSMFSYIHHMASKVMLWDTYLLWKTKPGDKTTRLLFLCLLPLILLGGFWFLTNISGAIYGLLSSNSTTTKIINADNNLLYRSETDTDLPKPEDIGSIQNRIENVIADEKTVNKVNLEPPTAEQIAASFTKEQINAIAMAVKQSLHIKHEHTSTEEIVEKIINNPSFTNMINNYHQASGNQQDKVDNTETLREHQSLIDKLLKEIESMRQEIILNNKLRHDDYARLSLNMRKCCEKRAAVSVEGYVAKLVTNLLNNPDFLNNQQGLNDWLKSMFIAKEVLELHLADITSKMDSKMAALVNSNTGIIMDKVTKKLVSENSPGPTGKTEEANIKKIVKQSLAIYDADKTGLVDYAMENMGGQILTTRCTEIYHHGKAVVSLFGIPLWHISNTPRTVITPTIAPGDCWAFQNFPGFVVIKLSSVVSIEAFSIEHISKLLLPDGKMDSAPKEFEVYGLRGENDREPVLLGQYKFEYDGEPLQFFHVDQTIRIFDMVELRIVSNHGNPNYTCLYRFRVHGKLHHTQER